MNPDWRSETIHGYKANYLYTYGGKIKEMIYLCKGCGDIEIAELFLQKQAKLIKLLNLGRLIVPAPSSKKKDEERGFNHVEKMFSEIGLPMVRALKKIDQVKQSDLNYEKRKEIKNHIRLVEGTNIKGKRILLVDDIITSGFTMKTCADLLMKNGAKSVKILAIARTLNA